MSIFESFYNSKNEEKAIKMAAYMKNKFIFLGIDKPTRMKLSKEFLRERKKDNNIDWSLVFYCYDMKEREFQYLALDYIAVLKSKLLKEDLEKIEALIITKSWWETVDTIAPIVGYMCLTYPELKAEVEKWIFNSNIWLKRVAIEFQLKYKDKTDADFLKKAILNNADTKEFFVNKAIGWALREYSKTRGEWVKNFIEDNKLSSLSKREGSKYIKINQVK